MHERWARDGFVRGDWHGWGVLRLGLGLKGACYLRGILVGDRRIYMVWRGCPKLGVPPFEDVGGV